MLVYLQDESVTFFGGVGFWERKFNRKVMEDARPYVILQPFRPVMLVYDVFQTEGEQPAQVFLETGLKTKFFEVSGLVNPKVLDDAITIARSWGIKVSFKPLSFISAAYVTTIHKGRLEIVLKKEHNFKQNIAAFIHELAHLFLGHTGYEYIIKQMPEGKEKKINIPIRELSPDVMELEAEVVSFLICKRLGLDTRAAEYMSLYIRKEEDLIDFSYELVIKTADKIEDLFFKKHLRSVLGNL